jgi:hypothetical protein
MDRRSEEEGLKGAIDEVERLLAPVLGSPLPHLGQGGASSQSG